MQKFPLRMKDNDLLVTELYHDPTDLPITAISVYLTPKTSKSRLYLIPMRARNVKFRTEDLFSTGPLMRGHSNGTERSWEAGSDAHADWSELVHGRL